MKIYKYTLTSYHMVDFELPERATFLSVQVQKGSIVLYFVVDESESGKESRRFRGIVTGGLIPDGLEYLGTVQLDGGDFVLHIFEDFS